MATAIDATTAMPVEKESPTPVVDEKETPKKDEVFVATTAKTASVVSLDDDNPALADEEEAPKKVEVVVEVDENEVEEAHKRVVAGEREQEKVVRLKGKDKAFGSPKAEDDEVDDGGDAKEAEEVAKGRRLGVVDIDTDDGWGELTAKDREVVISVVSPSQPPALAVEPKMENNELREEDASLVSSSTPKGEEKGELQEEKQEEEEGFVMEVKVVDKGVRDAESAVAEEEKSAGKDMEVNSGDGDGDKLDEDKENEVEAGSVEDVEPEDKVPTSVHETNVELGDEKEGGDDAVALGGEEALKGSIENDVDVDDEVAKPKPASDARSMIMNDVRVEKVAPTSVDSVLKDYPRKEQNAEDEATISEAGEDVDKPIKVKNVASTVEEDDVEKPIEIGNVATAGEDVAAEKRTKAENIVAIVEDGAIEKPMMVGNVATSSVDGTQELPPESCKGNDGAEEAGDSIEVVHHGDEVDVDCIIEAVADDGGGVNEVYEDDNGENSDMNPTQIAILERTNAEVATEPDDNVLALVAEAKGELGDENPANDVTMAMGGEDAREEPTNNDVDVGDKVAKPEPASEASLVVVNDVSINEVAQARGNSVLEDFPKKENSTKGQTTTSEVVEDVDVDKPTQVENVTSAVEDFDVKKPIDVENIEAMVEEIVVEKPTKVESVVAIVQDGVEKPKEIENVDASVKDGGVEKPMDVESVVFVVEDDDVGNPTKAENVATTSVGSILSRELALESSNENGGTEEAEVSTESVHREEDVYDDYIIEVVADNGDGGVNETYEDDDGVNSDMDPAQIANLESNKAEVAAASVNATKPDYNISALVETNGELGDKKEASDVTVAIEGEEAVEESVHKDVDVEDKVVKFEPRSEACPVVADDVSIKEVAPASVDIVLQDSPEKEQNAEGHATTSEVVEDVDANKPTAAKNVASAMEDIDVEKSIEAVNVVVVVENVVVDIPTEVEYIDVVEQDIAIEKPKEIEFGAAAIEDVDVERPTKVGGSTATLESDDVEKQIKVENVVVASVDGILSRELELEPSKENNGTKEDEVFKEVVHREQEIDVDYISVEKVAPTTIENMLDDSPRKEQNAVIQGTTTEAIQDVDADKPTKVKSVASTFEDVDVENTTKVDKFAATFEDITVEKPAEAQNIAAVTEDIIVKTPTEVHSVAASIQDVVIEKPIEDESVVIVVKGDNVKKPTIVKNVITDSAKGILSRELAPKSSKENDGVKAEISIKAIKCEETTDNSITEIVADDDDDDDGCIVNEVDEDDDGENFNRNSAHIAILEITKAEVVNGRIEVVELDNKVTTHAIESNVQLGDEKETSDVKVVAEGVQALEELKTNDVDFEDEAAKPEPANNASPVVVDDLSIEEVATTSANIVLKDNPQKERNTKGKATICVTVEDVDADKFTEVENVACVLQDVDAKKSIEVENVVTVGGDIAVKKPTEVENIVAEVEYVAIEKPIEVENVVFAVEDAGVEKPTNVESVVVVVQGDDVEKPTKVELDDEILTPIAETNGELDDMKEGSDITMMVGGERSLQESIEKNVDVEDEVAKPKSVSKTRPVVVNDVSVNKVAPTDASGLLQYSHEEEHKAEGNTTTSKWVEDVDADKPTQAEIVASMAEDVDVKKPIQARDIVVVVEDVVVEMPIEVENVSTDIRDDAIEKPREIENVAAAIEDVGIKNPTKVESVVATVERDDFKAIKIENIVAASVDGILSQEFAPGSSNKNDGTEAEVSTESIGREEEAGDDRIIAVVANDAVVNENDEDNVGANSNMSPTQIATLESTKVEVAAPSVEAAKPDDYVLIPVVEANGELGDKKEESNVTVTIGGEEAQEESTDVKVDVDDEVAKPELASEACALVVNDVSVKKAAPTSANNILQDSTEKEQNAQDHATTSEAVEDVDVDKHIEVETVTSTIEDVDAEKPIEPGVFAVVEDVVVKKPTEVEIVDVAIQDVVVERPKEIENVATIIEDDGVEKPTKVESSAATVEGDDAKKLIKVENVAATSVYDILSREVAPESSKKNDGPEEAKVSIESIDHEEKTDDNGIIRDIADDYGVVVNEAHEDDGGANFDTSPKQVAILESTKTAKKIMMEIVEGSSNGCVSGSRDFTNILDGHIMLDDSKEVVEPDDNILIPVAEANGELRDEKEANDVTVDIGGEEAREESIDKNVDVEDEVAKPEPASETCPLVLNDVSVKEVALASTTIILQDSSEKEQHAKDHATTGEAVEDVDVDKITEAESVTSAIKDVDVEKPIDVENVVVEVEDVADEKPTEVDNVDVVIQDVAVKRPKEIENVAIVVEDDGFEKTTKVESSASTIEGDDAEKLIKVENVAATGVDGILSQEVAPESSKENEGPEEVEVSIEAIDREEKTDDDGIIEAIAVDDDVVVVVNKVDEDDDGQNSDTSPAQVAILESTEATKKIMIELVEGSSNGCVPASRNFTNIMDGHIMLDEFEEDDDGDNDEKGFNSATQTGLLKAATCGSSGGNTLVDSQEGSKIFTMDRPVDLDLGSSSPSLRPIAPHQPAWSNLFNPSDIAVIVNPTEEMTEEEKELHDKVQLIRVKFLHLVYRLGATTEETVVAQVLYRLSQAEGMRHGRQTDLAFSLDNALKKDLVFDAEGKEDMDFSCNILVLGKTGVGKSATINSIFGEEKSKTDAFSSATTSVREIVGDVDGVKIRIIDTPGLQLNVMDQGSNKKILSAVKKYTKKCTPDVVLYVDRLDSLSCDLNDLPLLKTITDVLGSSIWFDTIVVLTHAASAPPEGLNGALMTYEVLMAQRSHIIQQNIRKAAGDMHLMNPVALVENHPFCMRNCEGPKVLPNGQSWRHQMLLLCYSSKILSEANSLLKLHGPNPGKLFGFHFRSMPLMFPLSSFLQPRAHPKLSVEQGDNEGDSDIELDDNEEYDQLPPFKTLTKAQLARLTKEQKNSCLDEYDYRVKLLQKKQWKNEIRRLKEMKKRGGNGLDDYGISIAGENDQDPPQENVSVPLADIVLPPSFDCGNPTYRYRFLEPTSTVLARPVLDAHGWDHDCGYDGVSVEETLAILNQFPTNIAVQVTKDKKEFSIHLDSSIAAKHGESASSLAGFDIQTIGRQLAYILRGETKIKNIKKNKTTGGFLVTFLGDIVATGLKVEDQLSLGKRLSLVASTGMMRAQGDTAYGANLEARLKNKDYPVGQSLSTLGLSLMKWHQDLAFGANLQSQFSIGRGSKMALHLNLNNKLSGHITVRTSTSEQVQMALLGLVPIAASIYRSFRPSEL